jgi:DNA-binding transcriptional ArsR family regulator
MAKLLALAAGGPAGASEKRGAAATGRIFHGFLAPRPAPALTIYSIFRIYATMKIQVDDMLTAADEASQLLKALANRHRLIIICQLIEKERSVGELAELLNIRDSTVSQHLALLRKDGLVTARRDGQTIWYAIGSAQARELVRTLYRVYCAPSSVWAPAPRRKAARPVRR